MKMAGCLEKSLIYLGENDMSLLFKCVMYVLQLDLFSSPH